MKRLLCGALVWWLIAQPAHAVQFGAGTGSGYPSAVDTVNTRVNKSGGACSSATGSNICAEFTNDLQGAIAAIETELGTLPKGSYADVKTRLNAAVYSGTAGLSSYTIGDLLYASSTTTLSRLAAVATGNVLRSGGVATAPAWGQVVLTTDVSGILQGANGGTSNGFFAVTGPASSLKTFTLPNVSETIATLGQAQTFNALQTFSANSISPTLIGGTGTTSTLTLQSTSGVGASGADIIFKVGNNGATEAGRIFYNGNFSIGGSTYRESKLYVNGGIRAVGSPNGYNDVGLGTFIGGNGVDASLLYGRNGLSWSPMFFDASQLWINGQSGGGVIIGSAATPASLLDLRAGDLTFSGANGQKYVQGRLTELVAVGSGLTTKATTIQIPADAIVYAVPVRVNTQPGGTANFTVTATTSGTAFQKGANISTAAGTTDPGTKNTPVNYNSTAAQTITFTFNGATTDALGVIRVDIYYATSTPPTS